MGRDYQKCKIAELVPYELHTTGPKRKSAKRDFKRDKEFTKPVPVFEVNGELVAKNGTNHIKVWLDLGHDEVPIVADDAPGDLLSVKEDWEKHFALKGFGNITDSDGLANRLDGINPHKIDKDALLKKLGLAKSDPPNPSN